MNTRVLLFVEPTCGAFDRLGNPWKYLLLPLAHEPAIVRYVRMLSDPSCVTNLVIPQALSEQLAESWREEFRIHTYSEWFGDGSLGTVETTARTTHTVLIDATVLPSIDLRAILELHRRGGAGMTVFCGDGPTTYCRETLRTDASGQVGAAIRSYRDSSGASAGSRALAAVLSRRAFRPDPGTRMVRFEELVSHLRPRFERLGEPVRFVRHAAVRGHPGPLEALLWLINSRGQRPTKAVAHRIQCTDVQTTDARTTDGQSTAVLSAGVRLHGIVEIGREVVIEPGAVIVGPACLGDGCRVESGAIVSRSIVLPGAIVRAGAHVHNGILGPRGAWSASDAAWGGGVESSGLDGDEAPLAPTSRSGGLKQAFDLVLAGTALLWLSPLLILIGLAVRLSSRGPILSRERRQGLRGAEFDRLKFRTVVCDPGLLKKCPPDASDPAGLQSGVEREPRVTRLGRWLRRTNLDGLPQLINVLKGEMSLVGPRPSPDRDNQYCPAWREMRLSVRPGVTGLWQVARSSVRSQSEFQERIYYDTRYVECQCLRLDAQILWQKVRMLLLPKG